VLAWLVVDRRRMTKELHEQREESAELSKRTEALQRSVDIERAVTSNVAAPHTNLQKQSDKSRIKLEKGKIVVNRENTTRGNTFEGKELTELMLRTNSTISGATIRGTARDSQGTVVIGAAVTLTDFARHFNRNTYTNEKGSYVFNAIAPGTYSINVEAQGFKAALVSNVVARLNTPTDLEIALEVGDVSETISVTAGAGEALVNTADASIGNSFESQRITQLPLNARNVANLLSLQPGVSSTGSVNGGRADQANITLDGLDATIPTSSSLSWTSFQIALKTAAVHEDYRVIIKTAGGRLVTSVDWIEPLKPNQSIIDTPVILTGDLPSGDYVLLLMGKEPDGSFIKVVEYHFKVIKH
jgi:Carboxypeptidase regulatory-like domain